MITKMSNPVKVGISIDSLRLGRFAEVLTNHYNWQPGNVVFRPRGADSVQNLTTESFDSLSSCLSGGLRVRELATGETLTITM